MILTATARRKGGAKLHIVARGDLEELRRIAKNVNKKYHTVIYSGGWKEVEVCNR